MNPVHSQSQAFLLQNERLVSPEKTLNPSDPSSNPSDAPQKNHSNGQNLINPENRRLEAIRALRRESEGWAGALFQVLSTSFSLLRGALECPQSLSKSWQNAQSDYQLSFQSMTRELGRYSDRIAALASGNLNRFRQLSFAADNQDQALNVALRSCEEALRRLSPVTQPELYAQFAQERELLRDSASKIELAAIVRSHTVFFSRNWQEAATGLMGAAACFGSGVLALASRNLWVSGILGGLGSGVFQVAVQLLAHEGRNAFHNQEDFEKVAQAALVGAACGIAGAAVGRMLGERAASRIPQMLVVKPVDVLTEVLADDAVSAWFSGRRNLANRFGIRNEETAPANEQRFGWKLFNNWVGESFGDRWSEGIQHRFIRGTRLDLVSRIQQRRMQEAMQKSLEIYASAPNVLETPLMFDPYLLAANDDATLLPFDADEAAANDNAIPWGRPTQQVQEQNRTVVLQANGAPLFIEESGNSPRETFRMSNMDATDSVIPGLISGTAQIVSLGPREVSFSRKIHENLRKELQSLETDFPIFGEIAQSGDPLESLRQFLRGQAERRPTHLEMQALSRFLMGGTIGTSLVSSIGVREGKVEQVSFHQIYTQEFLNCLVANILVFAEDFKSRYGRDPVIVDVSLRTSGLAQALEGLLPANLRLRSFDRNASFEAGDLFLSSWMPLGNNLEMELLAHLESHPEKAWMDITSKKRNHALEFWDRLAEAGFLSQRLMQSAPPNPRSPLPGLCYSFEGWSDGEESSAVYLHRSRRNLIPSERFKALWEDHRVRPIASAGRNIGHEVQVREFRKQYYVRRQALTTLDPEVLKGWVQRNFNEKAELFRSRQEASAFLANLFFSEQEQDQRRWESLVQNSSSAELLLLVQLLCGPRGFFAASTSNFSRLYSFMHQIGMRGFPEELGLFYVLHDAQTDARHEEIVLSLGFNGDCDADFLFDYYGPKIKCAGVAHVHKAKTGPQNALPSVVYERGEVNTLGDLRTLFDEYSRYNSILNHEADDALGNLHLLSREEAIAQIHRLTEIHSFNIVRSVSNDSGAALYVLRMRNGACNMDVYTSLKDGTRQEDVRDFYKRIEETYAWAKQLGITLRIYEYPYEMSLVEKLQCPRGEGENRDFHNYIFVNDELVVHPAARALDPDLNVRFTKAGRADFAQVDAILRVFYSRYFQKKESVTEEVLAKIRRQIAKSHEDGRTALRFEDKVTFEMEASVLEQIYRDLSTRISAQ